MNQIKSPFSKEMLFEDKIRKIFKSVDTQGSLVFYFTKEGDATLMANGLCGHDLLTIARFIKEKGEELLEKDPHKDGGE